MAKRGISLQSGGGNDDDDNNEEEKLLKSNKMNSTLEWEWMRFEHSLLDNAPK